MKRKEFVKDYFRFTRKERIGLLALVILIIIIAMLPHILNDQDIGHTAAADTNWIAAVKKLETGNSDKDQKTYDDDATKNDNDRQDHHSNNNTVSSRVLFYFDPNTVDQAGWLRLGLKEKTIRTIQN